MSTWKIAEYSPIRVTNSMSRKKNGRRLRSRRGPEIQLSISAENFTMSPWVTPLRTGRV